MICSGFGPDGISKGSCGADCMSCSAQCNGGGVPSGGCVACCQSNGAGGLIGFTTGGVVKGSIAAAMQAAIGNVGAGSVFAILQAAAATAASFFSTVASLGVGGIVTAVGSAVAAFAATCSL
ncbi:hypothetical protein WA158_000265 [Blastocystis sp. Blastoise]